MSAKRSAPASFADALGQARAELDRIREQVELVKIEIEETEQRPVDQDEIERRVDGAIAALAAHARRELPTGYFLNRRPSQVSFLAEAKISPLEMAALIWPGPLRAALQSVAAASAAVLPEGISAADRASAIAELQGRLQELERTEVAKLWAIEEAGLPAPWRSDLPAAVVLGMEPIP